MDLPRIASLDLRPPSDAARAAAPLPPVPAPAAGRRPQRRVRAFEAAGVGRLMSRWTTTNTSLDHDLRVGLKTLRARSRQLSQNNDYIRKFLWLVAANVVGPKGIGLQVRAGDWRNGAWVPDKAANALVEGGWKRWSRPATASVTGNLSRVDIERLMAWALVRDGEFLALRLRGRAAGNPFGYALQPLDPDYLDEEKNEDLANGNRIRMGVEKTPAGRPVAYHLLEWHPGDWSHPHRGGWTSRRVAAENVFHIFLAERPEQSRGVPWFYTAMRRLYQMGEYELAEVVAARIGASKMGFFQSSTGDQALQVADDEEEEEDGGEGALVMDAEPGKFYELPEGLTFQEFSPDHPNQGFAAFIKAMLRGVASGLGVSYASLSGDLAEVNFSSIRHGVLNERDFWMLLQEWCIEHFCQPVYDDWLPQALLAQAVPLPMRIIDKLADVRWQPRRWAWVDPAKDMAAAEKARALRIKSGRRIAAEIGEDWDDTQDEIDAEDQRTGGTNGQDA